MPERPLAEQAPSKSTLKVGAEKWSKRSFRVRSPAVGFLWPALEPLDRTTGVSASSAGARVAAPMMVRLDRCRSRGATGACGGAAGSACFALLGSGVLGSAAPGSSGTLGAGACSTINSAAGAGAAAAAQAREGGREHKSALVRDGEAKGLGQSTNAKSGSRSEVDSDAGTAALLFGRNNRGVLPGAPWGAAGAPCLGWCVSAAWPRERPLGGAAAGADASLHLSPPAVAATVLDPSRARGGICGSSELVVMPPSSSVLT